MSGFSPELIDYLEGKISFEEFERRREERKTREKKVRRWPGQDAPHCRVALMQLDVGDPDDPIRCDGAGRDFLAASSPSYPNAGSHLSSMC